MEPIIVFEYTPEFLKSAKALSKRYRSFADDLMAVCNEILSNPNSGDDMGNGVRKLRMAIKSKGKGKRGGARVITYSLEGEEENLKITFIYVYDKSDMGNISENKIKEILANNNLSASNPSDRSE